MLRLIREHQKFFLVATLAGLGLRLLFVLYFPAVTDDSRIYAELGTNWLQHGVYGQAQGGSVARIAPTDARVPGYPAFLAVVFWIFGVGKWRAVMLAQVLVDLVGCFVIADVARRMVGDSGARVAFVLAALCPFLANYTAAGLTETLEVFFTAVALDCAVVGLERIQVWSREAQVSVQRTDANPSASSGQALGHRRFYSNVRIYRAWAGCGVAIACCILLRPDGGILLAAVLFYLVWAGARLFFGRDGATHGAVSSLLLAGVIVCLAGLAPLVPWTIRNFLVMHHFQPLAPRYANETDELVPRGFNRWTRTWMADYVSVEEIYWNVPGVKIDAGRLPSRAFDSEEQRDATVDLIDEYNESQDVTPDLDARFGELAAERVRAHPVRYYVVLPVLRIADMWLRPRTENLPPDPRWWEFHDDRRESVLAVGFGVVNLAYVVAALLAVIRRRSVIRYLGLLVAFLLLRSAFLGTLENPEPRYTLEGYPAVIVMASALAVRRARAFPG